jgi:serine/threonine protein phosphatase PrpC
MHYYYYHETRKGGQKDIPQTTTTTFIECITMAVTCRRTTSSRSALLGFHRFFSPQLLGIFVLLVHSPSYPLAVHAECPSFGCSSKTLDIAADEGPLMDAMKVLRLGVSSGDVLEEELHDAQTLLQSTGDRRALTLTLAGYKGPNQQVNQDRALLIRPFRIVHGQVDSSKDTTIQLMGVFDGHGNGGERSSQHALEQVPERLARKLAAICGDDIHRLLQQDEEEMESAVKAALHDVFLEVDRTDPTQGQAGCTATVVLHLGSKLYIANAGDSTSFVGVYFRPKNDSGNAVMEALPPEQQVRIVYQTREDKPDLPEERERILDAGGYVHIPADPGQDVPRAYHVDPNGNLQWGLAMSRSLGDWSVQGVTAEPVVDVLNMKDIVDSALASHAETCQDGETEKVCEALDASEVRIFAVSASDGMMDELPPSYIGSVLARAFFGPDSNVHPLTAAENLILEAAKGWNRLFNGQYRDDIAISAVTIR